MLTAIRVDKKILVRASHADKEMVRIVGANHYYSGPGQREHLQEAIVTMQDWVARHGFAQRP